MKKIIFALLCVLCLASCSKDGSRTLSLTEFTSVSHSIDLYKPEECTKVTSLFSIVPGDAVITWRVTDELPQMTNYQVHMKLKLRLNHKVSVSEKFISEKSSFYFPYEFVITDENGVEETIVVGALRVASQVRDENGSIVDGMTNKDQFMDLVKFLQSEPGTEMELTLGALGSDNLKGNVADVMKSAKGIALKCGGSDERFESIVGVFE